MGDKFLNSQGETDIEQLAIVLHTLGTPTEDTWPGLQELPDYNKISFSTAAGLDWKEILPGVDDDSINFIKGFIEYDHSKRLGAKEVSGLVSWEVIIYRV